MERDEDWRDIVGYERFYKISNRGRVKSRCCILRPFRHTRGYLMVNLWKYGVCKKAYISRLVAKAFIPNPLNLPTVNHKDGNKENNNVENLEWMTYRDNSWHGLINGLLCVGEDHPNSKLKNSEVKYIKSLKGKYSAAEIAKKFNVSRKCISMIMNGQSWKWQGKIRGTKKLRHN